MEIIAVTQKGKPQRIEPITVAVVANLKSF